MIGRMYTVTFENVTVSAAQDLFEISPADDKPVLLMGLTLDNVGGTADAGDAQEELVRLLVRRGHTVSGSAGSSFTPVALPSAAGAAAAFGAEINNTTIANTGTTKDLVAFGWNTRVPLREFWPEEIMPGASQADTTIVVRLLSTPADAFSVSGTLYVIEQG
jgi:hypothetical protein